MQVQNTQGQYFSVINMKGNCIDEHQSCNEGILQELASIWDRVAVWLFISNMWKQIILIVNAKIRKSLVLHIGFMTIY